MTWAGFYLICFLTGFALTLVSFLAGSLHLPLPKGLHLHGGHGPAAHTAAGSCLRGARAASTSVASVFNFATAVAFLAWFGGTGYLLTHYHLVAVVLAFVIAIGGGMVGAAIVFFFLARLISLDSELDAADSEMVGVLGRVTVPIRAGGTGEIVFSQAGRRHSAGARNEESSAIAKGEEVVVTRYENGIAYVRRWQDLAGEAAEDAALAGN